MENLPELLKETFEIYNKFIVEKEIKKSTTQEEKDILFECVFKMRCVFDGNDNQRFLAVTDNMLKTTGAELCKYTSVIS